MGRKPGGDGIKIRLETRHVRRGGYVTEKKDVISIERRNREGNDSYAIDIDEK